MRINVNALLHDNMYQAMLSATMAFGLNYSLENYPMRIYDTMMEAIAAKPQKNCDRSIKGKESY